MRLLPVLLIVLGVFLLHLSPARVRCPAAAGKVPNYARATLATIGRQVAPHPPPANLRLATALRLERLAQQRKDKKKEEDKKRKERIEKRRRTAEEREEEERQRQAAAAAQLNLPAAPPQNQVAPPQQHPPANQQQQAPDAEDADEEEIENIRGENVDDADGADPANGNHPNADPNNVNGNRINPADNNQGDPNIQLNGINGGQNGALGANQQAQNPLHVNGANLVGRQPLAPAAVVAETSREITELLAGIPEWQQAHLHRRTFRTLVRQLHLQLTGLREPEAFVSTELQCVVGVFLLINGLAPRDAQVFSDSATQPYILQARYVVDHRHSATVILRVDSSAQGHNMVWDDELVVGHRPERFVYPPIPRPLTRVQNIGVTFRMTTLNNGISDFVEQLLRLTGATSVAITQGHTRYTVTYGSPEEARSVAVLMHAMLLQGSLFQVEQ